MIFVGVDWAEAHHDVHVEDGEGRRLGRRRIPEGVEGLAQFHHLVAEHAEEPGDVVIRSKPIAVCLSARWSPTPHIAG